MQDLLLADAIARACGEGLQYIEFVIGKFLRFEVALGLEGFWVAEVPGAVVRRPLGDADDRTLGNKTSCDVGATSGHDAGHLAGDWRVQAGNFLETGEHCGGRWRVSMEMGVSRMDMARLRI